jgi:hypothetical protein
MKVIRFCLSIFGVIVLTQGTLDYSKGQPGKEKTSIDMKSLSAVDKPFKIAPYVRAAVLLQGMGKEKACAHLAKLAEEGDEGQVSILCRMLFSKKGQIPFRNPNFGVPAYLGSTTNDDWPLSPLEYVDDVPFFVVRRYELQGERESSAHYLNYCIKNCDWSATRFDKVDEKTIEKALRTLLASKKWKVRLTDFERDFLVSETK